MNSIKYAIVLAAMLGFASGYGMQYQPKVEILNNSQRAVFVWEKGNVNPAHLGYLSHKLIPSYPSLYKFTVGFDLIYIYSLPGIEYYISTSDYGVKPEQVILWASGAKMENGRWISDLVPIQELPYQSSLPNQLFVAVVNPDGTVKLEGPQESNVEVLDVFGRPDGRPLVQPKIYRFLGAPVPATPQQILGIRQNATKDEARQAFKILSVKLHPDRNKAPEANDAFKLVAWAHAKLTE